MGLEAGSDAGRTKRRKKRGKKRGKEKELSVPEDAMWQCYVIRSTRYIRQGWREKRTVDVTEKDAVEVPVDENEKGNVHGGYPRGIVERTNFIL